MDNAKKHYWGVVSNAQRTTPLHTGSFNDCWEWLVENFGGTTLKDLDTAGIKVTRINY